MIQFPPITAKDAYKVGHIFQYPKKTTRVYSNSTCRGSRIEGVTKTVQFSQQYFVQDYLLRQFGEWFAEPRGKVMDYYRRRIGNMLGPLKSYDHIANLHDLGYMPLKVKSLPEGSLVPLRVPNLTIRNTHDDFYWVTNMVESIMSAMTWRGITSATTAFGYRREFERYAKKTGAARDFVKWQGHDFSMRGMDPDAGIVSGAGHALSFTGSDTIHAIDFLEHYYGANSDKELVLCSVPATEHSVICMGGEDNEELTIERLATEVYPEGIFSNVSDTWDFWYVLTVVLPKLRHVLMARNGKYVVRPDSGDPVKVICGDPDAPLGSPQRLGAIRILYAVFGGQKNAGGYIELDPHIGLIYGDSITPDRQREILSRLEAMGFASSNVVLGIGSFTYTYVTRDTFGQAIKATYGIIDKVGRPLFKKPATDDGTKHSAKGLLRVNGGQDLDYVLEEECSWEYEAGGALLTIFEDSKLYNQTTLNQIRGRIDAQIERELLAA